MKKTARLRHYAAVGVLGGLAVSVPLPVVAQNSAPTTVPVADPTDFPLTPGDQVSVVVTNHPEMSGTAISVSETGEIAVPVIGNVYVNGKTLREVQQALTARLRKEVKNPVVAVTVSAPAQRSVTVLGPVANPGKLSMQPGWHVYDAIVNAGGLLRPGDEVVGTLLRGRMQVPLKISDITAKPASAANLLLVRGDVLNLSLAPGTLVTVTGDVKTPGQMVLRRSSRILDALSNAGGLNQAPERTKVIVTHGNQRESINLIAAFADRNSPANLQLNTGDVVTVQAIRTTFAVASLHGLVRTPNNFTLDGRITVSGAVLAAGGLTVPPGNVIASIRRGDKTIPVDLERAFREPEADLLLEDNDVLNVNPPAGPAINISGNVKTPGPIYLKKNATILDAVLGAGGFVGKPEETKVTILRYVDDRAVVLNVDPVALVQLTDLGQNVRLNDGDVVFVNQSTPGFTVFVTGEVQKQGAYDVKDGEGLTEVLLRAGGVTPSAAMTQVRVTRRDGTVFTVDASGVFLPDAPRVDYVLQEGDRVDIPKNSNQVLILQAVAKPGYYSIPEKGGLTLVNALLAAGGPAGGARLNQVTLVRKQADGTTLTKTLPIDKNGIGTGVGETPLQPNDIIIVPEASARRNSTLPLMMSVLGGVRLFF